VDDTLKIPGFIADSAWIDQLPDGLLVCGSDGVVVLANERLCGMSGYRREDIVGMCVDRLVPEARRQGHETLRQGFVAENRTRPMGHPGADLRLARADGEDVPVEISLSPISSGPIGVGGGRGVIAIVRDVSERNRVEAALQTTSELLSLADERERIARDLHDTVLQRLFGLGLELQAASMRAEPVLAQRLTEFVDDIDTIIKEVRTAVFTLGASRREGSLGQELSIVVSQAKRVLGFTPRLRLDGAVETATSPEIRAELLASLREALANVGRHAAATDAEIELKADDVLTLRVLDNGRGVPEGFDTSAGNGLRNMAERARRLGGGCALTPRTERDATNHVHGSELRWWVPLPG
jgi:PAS domain S-box-containing protein